MCVEETLAPLSALAISLQTSIYTSNLPPDCLLPSSLPGMPGEDGGTGDSGNQMGVRVGNTGTVGGTGGAGVAARGG